MHNARFGIYVLASLSAAGSDTHIAHTTITDNEAMENGAIGIYLISRGNNNLITGATLARNTASGNALVGINVQGGFAGTDGNTLDVRIKDNAVADNGIQGIRVVAGTDNSSHNHVVAEVRGNTVERNQFYGILTIAANGAVGFPTGTSNNNVLDLRIVQNTVKSQAGVGIGVSAGVGSGDGRAGAVADNNHTTAIVMRNTVEGSPRGIELAAGGPGLASSNTTEVWVAHNTVCNNAGTDIVGEGGFSGNILFPEPNLGIGNVLTGQIFQNTATTVVVADGTPGNTANVTQFKNDLCQ